MSSRIGTHHKNRPRHRDPSPQGTHHGRHHHHDPHPAHHLRALRHPRSLADTYYVDASPLLLDGEVVAFDDGRPSFSQLQQRMHVTSAAQAARLFSRIPVSYLISDILDAAGQPLLDMPYWQRRELLARPDQTMGSGPLRGGP